MDFEFFDKLSAADARKFLKNFLEREQSAFLSIEDELLADGVDTQFDIDNVEGVVLWVLGKLRTSSREADAALPSWIHDTPSYVRGLFDFENASGILILRAAFFFGESFVRSDPKLTWTIGGAESIEKNMPVVSGFRNSMEMAPIMVLENIYRRIIADNASTEDIPKAIRAWTRYLPSTAMI